MCTLTFVPLLQVNSFVFTSNRDESVERGTELPRIHISNGRKLLFPKDKQAGGTWIGASDQKRAVCLMNGGFQKHVRKLPYKHSRGTIVKDLLATSDFFQEVKHYYLKETEPFTCIIVDWHDALKLFRLVWDGEERHFEELPVKSYIWSSSFLYSEEARERREKLFARFRNEQESTPRELMRFHSSEVKGEKENLIIDKGLLKTCSITQVIKSTEGTKMLYKDLLKSGKPEHETATDW